MSTTKLAAVSGLVLFLATLNAAGVESLPYGCHVETRPFGRRVLICDGDNSTPDNPPPLLPPPPPAELGPSMFVFGDSFVDNGNLLSDEDHPELHLPGPIIRQFHLPYGTSYGNDDGSTAAKANSTGRFSNYLVQSDFIGRMLGYNGAPPTHLTTGKNGICDNAGMTFAAGGSGVFPVPSLGVPTLSDQVDKFEYLVGQNCITPDQINRSVALIAVSGNDYDRVGVAQPSGFGDVTVFTKNVTSQIAAAVDRLVTLGLDRIIVNNLPPAGCAPAQTVPNNYKACDGAGNAAARSHNDNLNQLLADKVQAGTVLVLDLYGVFIDIVDTKGSELSQRFYNKKTPCCVGTEPNGLCGDMGGTKEDPIKQHKVCTTPEKHFYWDEMNPTQAGWTAVMSQLQDPIHQFIWPEP